jgi:hypothetical protein
MTMNINSDFLETLSSNELSALTAFLTTQYGTTQITLDNQSVNLASVYTGAVAIPGGAYQTDNIDPNVQLLYINDNINDTTAFNTNLFPNLKAIEVVGGNNFTIIGNGHLMIFDQSNTPLTVEDAGNDIIYNDGGNVTYNSSTDTVYNNSGSATLNPSISVFDPSPSTPTTQDYTQTGLSTLLANAVSSTELTNILNHHPNGAVVETDTNGPYIPLPEIQDSNGNNPDILLLANSGNLVNFDNFANAHTVILQNNQHGGTDFLTLNGTGENVHLYVDDLSSSGGGNYIITDNMNNNKLVISGFDTTTNVNVAGSQTIVAKDGWNAFNINEGNITLRLGEQLNVGQNDVMLNGGNTTITGFRDPDTLYFNQPMCDATITKTLDAAGHKITEVSLVGVNVMVNGWHDGAIFAGDPSIHYI